MGRRRLKNDVSAIYIISNAIDKKAIVGYSANAISRMYEHRRQLLNNSHSNKYLQNSFNKYGDKNFEFEILEEYEREFLPSMENWWANMLNTHNREYGYNIAPTGPYLNPGMSQETINLQKEVQKRKYQEGYINPMTGKIHSDETRKKISDSVKLTFPRKPSKRKNLPSPLKGKPKSEEHNKKVSLSNSNKVIQKDLDGNFIKEWESARLASDELNIDLKKIQNSYNPKYPFRVAGGFRWELKRK